MIVLLAVDPDTAFYRIHPVVVEPVEPERILEDLRIELHVNGELVETLTPPDTLLAFERSPCVDMYGSGFVSTFRCLPLETVPSYGDHVRLVVSATERPTASAETAVPGDFDIVSLSARGDPLGTESLEAHWTPSAGAWRYVVGVQVDSVPGCDGNRFNPACHVLDWFVATADTFVRTRVPENIVETGEGARRVLVFAVTRGLYEHLTTGTSGDYFSVPPAQNVEGGYGAVGAWVVRSAPVTSTPLRPD